MNTWNRFWFGEVPRVRCQLLIIALSLAVAFDCWINFLPQAALHGMTDFHVAHVAILDQLPFAPSAPLYGLLQISVGLLLLAGLGTPYRRWLHFAACGLFTWGWMMSQLDSFQHHYFLSLALLCTAWLDVQATRRHPYKLLGVLIAILYFFTAVAKAEPVWISGIVLRNLGEPHAWPRHLIDLLQFGGLSPASAWSLLSVGVIVAECVLAMAYLAASIWPQTTGKSGQLATCIALAFALLTHISIESLHLKIGWFSYYMMILAVVFFTPVTWLEAIASRLSPLLTRQRTAIRQHLTAAGCAAFLFLLTCVCSPMLVEYRLLRAAAWLEKGHPATALETLNRFSALDPYQSEARQIRLQTVRLAAYRGLHKREEAMQLAGLLNAYPSLPAQTRLELAAHALETDNPTEAVEQLTAIISDAPNHVEAKAQLGLLYLQSGQLAQGEELLRQALAVHPSHRDANYDLGVLLVLSDRATEATPHLRRVLEHQPEHGQARYYLAITHDLAGELAAARHEYARALTYLPELHDARLNLAKLVLEQGQPTAALNQLQQIPRDASCYDEAATLIKLILEQPAPP